MRFIRAEAASGIILIVNTVLALWLANSALHGRVEQIWQLAFSIPGIGAPLSLRELVSDGLMALFFLVVGLEIKRELIDGELASVRRAALPVLGALGGMLAPALIYWLLRVAARLRGFGIPTATDIAFTVGVMTLLGRRVPRRQSICDRAGDCR